MKSTTHELSYASGWRICAGGLISMNCRTCGAPLPSGAAFCTTCGSATPYNVDPRAAAQKSYDPTVAASSYQYDPTVGVPQQPFQQTPSTSYGSPSDPYGAPPPPQNAYNPSSGYGNYNAQGMQNTPSPQGPYGAQQYGYPAQGTPGGYPPAGQPMPGMPGQPGPYGTPAQPKRRSRVGLIIGIVVLVLVLACAGIVVAATLAARNAPSTTTKSTTATTATTTTGTTPTTQPTTAAASDVPATSAIVPSAAVILNTPKTSSAVDQNLLPTSPTSTFKTGQKIYVTFVINSQGKNGYIQVKWYQNGQSLTSDILTHHAENDRGYFSLAYNEAGDGAVAMYWCVQANCSDAQLAQIVKFTVTATALAPATQNADVLSDIERRNVLLG